MQEPDGACQDGKDNMNEECLAIDISLKCHWMFNRSSRFSSVRRTQETENG